MKQIHRLADFAYTLARTISIAALVGMTLIVVLNIVARSALNQSFSWSEEACRFLLIWASLLGAAMAVRRAAHFRLDLSGALPGAMAPLLARLPAVAAVLSGSLLVWQGGVLMKIASMQLATATQIPMSVPYAVLPLSGLLMLIFGIEALAQAPRASETVLVK